MGSGKAGGPPKPPLPVPYILERHPLPGASQPKGSHGLHFDLPLKWGTAREAHRGWVPGRREGWAECSPPTCLGGGSGRGVPVALSGMSHLLSIFR